MRRFFTPGHGLLLAVFLWQVVRATGVPVDTDTWWHLCCGRYVAATGAVIRADHFSHTFLGRPRVHYDWGAELALYGAWRTAGALGLGLYTAALAVAGLAFAAASGRGSNGVRAGAVFLSGAAAAVYWTPRPLMVSFALTGVVLWLVAEFRRGRDRLWLVPLLMLVWAQFHAGWAQGFIVLGTVLVGETLNRRPRRELMRLAGWTALGAMALLANPFGWRLLLVPFETVGMGVLRQAIEEWNPPPFTDPRIVPFLLLLAWTALALARTWRRPDWTEILLAAVAGTMALTAVRHVAFFALVAVPILTRHGSNWWQERRRALAIGPLLPWAVAVVVGILVIRQVVRLADPVFVRNAQAAHLPVGAVDYLLADRPPGPLYNCYRWGGYLMWRAPEYPVYVDGRTDLYRGFVVHALGIWQARPGWQVDLRGQNLVLIEADAPLTEPLRRDPGWAVAYEDGVAVVFVRRP